ncbi:MAG: S41 family peptidase [Nitrospinota bacterium]
MKKKLRYFRPVAPLLFFGFLLVCFWQKDAIGKTYDSLKDFAEVLSKVEKNYVEKVDSDKLITGAINGMLKTLDPHSSYMTKDMYKEMKVETEGEFGGLGIEITIKDEVLTIVSPIEGTPAYEAGLKPWDRIIKINQDLTRDLSLMGAVKKMRGKPGTDVDLTILREGKQEPFVVTLTRSVIKIKSVTSRVIEKSIGYIKVRRFSKSTAKELEEEIQKIEKKDTKSLILDLRNNPGGLLRQAVEVSEMFLPKKSLIVYTRGRLKEQDLRYVSKRTGIYIKKPVVVLVNAGSASASEIVAGALQDLDRAVILGTPTFGKGSVQTIIPISDGAGLRLTTALYYTPNDRQIQGVGIEPDIIVEPRVEKKPKEAKKEKEKKKAPHMTRLREKDLKNHLKGEEEKEEKPKSQDNSVKKEDKEEVQFYKNDTQLTSAVSLLTGISIFQKL